MTVEINGVKFVTKTRYKVKEVKHIEELLSQSKGENQDTLALLCALCDVTGDTATVDIEEFYEDDIFNIIKSYTDYKKKLMESIV